ncbi:hypothetical protein [Aeromicrobium sp. 179-A 4D2 NHS]|uniref:hypothetical protein n=1 Tax=Aeromicrobium sp. 179-A 4D2 NHS TaxID=3142375 RepID=UPI0039A27F45
MTATYEASPVKRRRRTRAQLDALDDAIVAAVRTEHPVTLRGVFYRVVSADAVEKTEAGYQAVGRRLLELRRSGRIPYSWIADGSRVVHRPETWTGVDRMLVDLSASYRRSLWHNQAAEVIVISEKDAISGVILPITYQWDVELAITRGYSSETFTHSIAQSIIANDDLGKTTYVYQLGDHDPSGADAWRDFQDKVHRFAPGVSVHMQRIAVTPAQIDEFNLPTRPTKSTDTRAPKFAGDSVEVDAIAPTALRAIVETAITQHVDPTALRAVRIAEESEREGLRAMAAGWSV